MIGDYRVEAAIGEGTFGAVYRVVQPIIGKRAAVKVLNREFCADPDWVARFVDEARAVNRIKNRNIIDIFTFGTTPAGQRYFAMELLEGETLEHYIAKNAPLDAEVAVAILRTVARALDAAHAAGVVHRDLKPENVFLTFDEAGAPQPKLLDFGIAKLRDSPSARAKTQAGMPLGTPLYMSPEQCNGDPVDHRSDIYSLGLVAFEALTGKRPFGGGVAQVMMAHAHHPPPRPSSIVPRLGALDAAMLTMLEKDPARRPASALEGIDAIARAAGIVGSTALPQAPYVRSEPREVSGSPARSATKGPPVALVVAGLVLALAGAAVGISLAVASQSRGATSAPSASASSAAVAMVTASSSVAPEASCAPSAKQTIADQPDPERADPGAQSTRAADCKKVHDSVAGTRATALKLMPKPGSSREKLAPFALAMAQEAKEIGELDVHDPDISDYVQKTKANRQQWSELTIRASATKGDPSGLAPSLDAAEAQQLMLDQGALNERLIAICGEGTIAPDDL